RQRALRSMGVSSKPSTPATRTSRAGKWNGAAHIGYNVQVAVDTEHHLIITHEVTNDGSDRAQLANIASQAKEVLGVDELEAVADRGYYSSEEILACDKAGIAITLPKPMTSGIETRGRFGNAGLCLSQRRGCVSLSGWRKAEVLLYERG